MTVIINTSTTTPLPIAEDIGAPVDSFVANGATLSAEIDLGAVYRDVELRMNATEAAQLGTAAATRILVKDEDGNFNVLFNEAMSGGQSFAKPSSGGVRAKYFGVNSRYIKVEMTVATGAQVDFTVRGVGKLVFTPALERATLP